MTDLIERLRRWPGECDRGLGPKAADEIERLRGDYDRCDHALTVAIRVAKQDKDRIAKLQAVVDAAKVVQLVMDGDEVDCPFRAYDGLQDALAALEDDNDLP